MQPIRLALAVAAGLACAGCFQMSTAVTVAGDGSGTIVQRLVFTPQAMAQLRQLAAASGRGAKPFDPVSEDQARADAAKIGPGVTYVSSRPIDDPSGQGRESTYRFADISQLHLQQRPSAPSGMAVRSDEMNQAKPSMTFAVSTLPNGHALLTITVPHQDFTPSGMGLSRGGDADAQQMAMARQLFAGARLAITIQPDGRLVHTSSPYVTGDTVTLLDVDFDQLLAGDTAERLRAATTAEEAKATLKAAPGLKVNLDPTLTIEFTPAK
ncbi:MAG TPA: hypothetical protein VL309_10290 [Vicinamibacterales bacterium]|jgi:hypothetical protein|nr:hypothetical protein [Vicinamibacterales bacterium]